MGIDATAEHVSVGGEASADLGWSGGGFADLDVAGVLESVHGRGSEGTAQSNGVATPVGGALNAPSYSNDSLAEERNIPFSDENNNTPDNQSDVRQTNEASPLRQIDGRLLFMPLCYSQRYNQNPYYQYAVVWAHMVLNLPKVKNFHISFCLSIHQQHLLQSIRFFH